MRALIACTLWLASAAWAFQPPEFKLDLRIPHHRPYLTLTPGDVARARARVARESWAREILDKVVADANASLATPWGKLPPKGDNEHVVNGHKLFGAALAHALTGERRYAEWTRDGLAAYAAIYPGLPISNLRVKVFVPGQGPLFEAMWIVLLAQAYDLVADSGVFTQAQKKAVESDLLRASMVCFRINDFEKDPRIRDLHYRCYNFQAWHISAMGLVGLALGDRELVDYAINSPYGLRHLIAHDIRDDGMFWERSGSYHRFVMSALLPFTEALLHCGANVYTMEVPALRSRDEDQHYVTDTSDRPKSLRLLWQGPFYMSFPDLSYPALGDSDRGPLRGSWEVLLGYNRYRDPKAAWLVAEHPARDWHFLVHDLPPAATTSLPLPEGPFAHTGEYRNGCSLFPSTGLALLRQAREPDSTAASLSYGPYGGGHGHPDKLNLVVYAHGRQWIPAFGSMQYYTHWKADWTSQTISHNTIVVDGISQRPTGARTIEWPADTAADRVLGKLEHFDPAAQLASASCDRLYDGLRLKRTVRLTQNCVIDDYVAAPTADSAPAHRFDYVLHIDGKLEGSSSPFTPLSGPLGDRLGYQLVERKQGLSAKGAVHFTFSEGARRLRIWVVPTDQSVTEAVIAEGLTNSPDVKMPMLVLRRQGQGARFLTIIEPVNTADEVRSVKFEQNGILIEGSGGARRVTLP